jgi:hypothetical protein
MVYEVNIIKAIYVEHFIYQFLQIGKSYASPNGISIQ